MKALAAKTTQTIGNFWNYLVLSCTRVLLPLSLIVGFYPDCARHSDGL